MPEPVAVLEPAGALCANRGAALTGRYCGECGQKVVHGPPTVPQFLQEGFDEAFSVDGRFFRSVQYLLLKPGLLTCELFDGRRQRYLRPYLTFSVLAFAVMALMPCRSQNLTDLPPASSTQAHLSLLL